MLALPGDSQMGQHKPFLMAGEDDLSHELKPDGIVPTKKPRARKTRPTPTHSVDEDGRADNADKSWTPPLSTTLVSDQEQVLDPSIASLFCRKRGGALASMNH